MSNVAETQYGFTPLMTALFNGHYDLAGLLIEKGAGVNDGSLYLTIEMRNLAFYKNRPNPPDRDKTLSSMDVLKMLLDRGADPNTAYTKKIPPARSPGRHQSYCRCNAAVSRHEIHRRRGDSIIDAEGR